MTTLIYTLIDPRDNQIRYVGKTTQTLERRFNCHLYDNSKCKKTSWVKSLKLQGLQPIIKQIDSVEDNWEFWENYWICNLKILGFDLLNHTDGGDGMTGYIPSKETREKWSNAFKGRKLSEEWKNKISEAQGKKVEVFDLEGTYRYSFPSLSRAALYLKISRSHITECCKGELKSCNNMIFRYKGDSVDKYDTIWKSRTPILQLDKNGSLIKEWDSITEAAINNNIKQQAISRCLRGIRKTCKQCKWEYKIKI